MQNPGFTALYTSVYRVTAVYKAGVASAQLPRAMRWGRPTPILTLQVRECSKKENKKEDKKGKEEVRTKSSVSTPCDDGDNETKEYGPRQPAQLVRQPLGKLPRRHLHFCSRFLILLIVELKLILNRRVYLQISFVPLA